MKHHHANLTRIAATHKGNPLKASPVGILQEFFNYATPGEHAKAFDAFCRAALKEKYCWRRGSPGNALHYAEQLELLLEAAYLIDKDRRPHRTRLKPHQALQYVKTFFRQASLGKWKKRLHIFTRTAISHQSAGDEMKPIAIYVFITGIELLLHMAAMMVENHE